MIATQDPRSTVLRQRSGAMFRQRSAVCSMTTEARTVPALRAFARDMATQWGTPAETVDALRMIATELVTNTLLHSGSSEVSLLLTVDSSTATIQVKDTGRWQERRRAAEIPEQALDGRGLQLVHAYSTACWVNRSPQGTTVRAELQMPLPAPDGAGHAELGRRQAPPFPGHNASGASRGDLRPDPTRRRPGISRSSTRPSPRT